jgi:hypothetical protein
MNPMIKRSGSEVTCVARIFTRWKSHFNEEKRVNTHNLKSSSRCCWSLQNKNVKTFDKWQREIARPSQVDGK